MALTWLEGVERVVADRDAGSFITPVRRFVWHTTEGTSIEGAIGAYRQHQSWPHLTWNPRSGRIVQHIPFNRAARALKNPPGGGETNRAGVIQVEVVGRAVSPFTDSPMLGLDRIMAVARAFGIPDEWPAGSPGAYPECLRTPRSSQAWARSGHFGHSQVPENDHGDPGCINVQRLFGLAGPPLRPGDFQVVSPLMLTEVSGVRFSQFYVAIPTLDDQGRGWFDIPAPIERVFGLVAQGSSPPDDGYWPPVTLNAQSRGGATRVTVAGLPRQPAGAHYKLLEAV